MILDVNGMKPFLGKVFVAPTAVIIGDVEVGDGSSVWFNATLRGDVAPIRIGCETSIQDNCCLHGTFRKYDVRVGNRVTVGHGVILHGCKIGDGCLVGMGATILDGVEVGERCLIGAGSLLTQGKTFEPGMLIMGSPAKAVRPLTMEELQSLETSADNYLLYQSWYKSEVTK